METTKLIINIDLVYFIGIVGSILYIAIRLSIRFGKLENSIDWIKEKFKEHWEAILANQQSISTLQQSLAGMEASGSPLDPTKFGADHIKKSGLQKIIDETNKEELLKKLKKSLPEGHTEYDVQETARRVMVSMRNSALMKPIKDYAFKNGVVVNVLLSTSGLLLRDNFLGRKHQIVKNSKGR